MEITSIDIESAAISDRGLSESRPHNEDSYLDLPSRGIFAVADGVGGAEAGEVASQIAIEILSEAFVNAPEDVDCEYVMRQAIGRANESIFQLSSEIPALSRMATTLAAVAIKGDVATVGHVGDSRVYRLTPNRVLIQETDDHSIVADEVRAGRLSPEQAAVHPSRNIISRALGAEPSVEADMRSILIEPGTTLLVCSDGVTRHVPDAEIRDLLGSQESTAAICGRIKDVCFQRGAEDNLTAVVVRFGDALIASEPADESYYPLEDEVLTIATARFETGVDEPLADVSPTGGPPMDAEEVEDHEAASVESSNDVKFVENVEPGHFELDLEENESGPEPTIEESAEKPVLPFDQDAISDRHRELFGASIGYGDETEKRAGRSVLVWIGMLLFGAIAGGAAVYLWIGSRPIPQPEVPVLNEMKSSNIPLTEFEESRRIVDRDPKQYITANSNPQEAKDYFLLGRAYLLTGNWFEARNAFTAAKAKISDVEPRDAATVLNEINLALAVIGDPQATEDFSKSLSGGGQISPSTANANSRPRDPAP